MYIKLTENLSMTEEVDEDWNTVVIDCVVTGFK